MKMKVNKTNNELEVSDLKTYRLKNEERMKNDEERWKIFMKSLTETSRKHLDLDFLHENTFFHPKQLKCIT